MALIGALLALVRRRQLGLDGLQPALQLLDLRSRIHDLGDREERQARQLTSRFQVRFLG